MSHQFGKPPTMAEAEKRKLLAFVDESGKPRGIHTFSNGTSWEYWAAANCYRCKWWDPETAGTYCAFEAAAFLGMVTPALAEMFGWINDAEYGDRSYSPPDECAYFKDRDDDSPDPPFIDPLQLTFLVPDGWPEPEVISADPALASLYGEPAA